jgi:uncharacterized protein YndB with AHSA1/START domain
MTDMQASPEQQVLITRIFEAPRDVVFRAWTDPDQVAQWFGPDGFDTPRETVEIDLRVGGRFELTMVQKQSSARFPVRYEIVELDPPWLLVLRSDPCRRSASTRRLSPGSSSTITVSRPA